MKKIYEYVGKFVVANAIRSFLDNWLHKKEIIKVPTGIDTLLGACVNQAMGNVYDTTAKCLKVKVEVHFRHRFTDEVIIGPMTQEHVMFPPSWMKDEKLLREYAMNCAQNDIVIKMRNGSIFKTKYNAISRMKIDINIQELKLEYLTKALLGREPRLAESPA
jgi:hypothetical protein